MLGFNAVVLKNLNAVFKQNEWLFFSVIWDSWIYLNNWVYVRDMKGTHYTGITGVLHIIYYTGIVQAPKNSPPVQYTILLQFAVLFQAQTSKFAVWKILRAFLFLPK